ncbi:DNA primase [Spongiibacter taiwanensis]|uniref:DNA primase n=1 Tax=Spongiibacter taiwanensis TaxID=1748242 RepID=UPI002035D6E3|nr:DNA primase [Spongiibacter taiwanensis]USA42832.1 DNA primase [Spongiibacter taiwanensis]
MAAKGLIPQYFIDDLLSRVDIVDVINRRVALKKAGRNYTARCPFHEEKTPSFSVNPDKQFYYCFGCGASGNAIGFLMDYERQDFPQAVETLATSAGVDVPREELSPRQAQQQERRKTIYDLMEQISKHYQQQLRDHPQGKRAVDYLKKRGLSGRIARDFELGYAPPGWDNLLREFGQSDSQRQQLMDAGMLVEREDGKIYDRFRDRIMFPIRDNRGRVVAFGGRVLGDEKPKYLNSPETDIFHKSKELYGLYQARQRNRQIEQLLVVEGYMDVVALAQNDINIGIATLGTASNTDHLRTAFRYCSEVVICFDGDEAGRRAAQRALENALPAMEDGRQIRFLFLPEGEDPDSLVRTKGSAGFRQLLAKASPLESFFFESFYSQADPNTLEGKARLAKLAAPMLNQLPDGVFKQLMLDALAQRTGLSRSALDQLLAAQPEAAPVQSTAQGDEAHPAAASPGPVTRRADRPLVAKLPKGQQDPLRFALAMLLFNPRCVNTGAAMSLPTLEGSATAALLQELISLLRRRPDTNTAALLGYWQGQPQYQELTQALKTIELLGASLNDELATAAFVDVLKHLEKQKMAQYLQEELEKLQALSRPAKAPDPAKEMGQKVDKAPQQNYAQLDDEQKKRLAAIQEMLRQRHKQ